MKNRQLKNRSPTQNVSIGAKQLPRNNHTDRLSRNPTEYFHIGEMKEVSSSRFFGIFMSQFLPFIIQI